ncbi:MAG: hypothetical protein HY900_04395 [Deltaproteobacteria bacterium]|nr:hypothetical protein [Deltaproteobacteria bacterium]
MEPRTISAEPAPSLAFLDEPACWNEEHVETGRCLYSGWGEQGALPHRKRLVDRCLVCERFHVGDPVRGASFGHLVDEVLSLRSKLQAAHHELDSLRRQLRLLDEITPLFQASANREEVMATALTAVTAGKGLGLNRAILLLLDSDRQALEGRLAVGPRRREEAARIWRELEQHDYSLDEMVRLFFENRMAEERAQFQDLLDELSTPLSREDHLFVRSFLGPEALYVQDLEREPAIDRSQIDALGVRELVLVPLASEGRRLGLLLADNLVNGRPLSPPELVTLSSFGRQVAAALERAGAEERLRDRQEQAIRRAKIALTEKISAAVAHSIRNPLTAIGGFARRLSGATSADDPRRSYADFIISEAKRLEGVLGEILAYSEAAQYSLRRGSLNDLVRRCAAELLEERRGREIHLALEESLPLVDVDAAKTSSCLKALANRALDAMEGGPGGRLEIATGAREGGTEIVLTAEGLAPGQLDGEEGSVFPEALGESRGFFLCVKLLEGQGAALRLENLGGGSVRFRLSFRPSRALDREQRLG